MRKKDYEISDEIKRKFKIPSKFKSEEDEIRFWQKCSVNKKMQIHHAMMVEYCIKNMGMYKE